VAQVSKLATNTYRGVYTIKGDYYFNHKNYTVAINNYSKSINQNPKDIHCILKTAEANYRLGKNALAEQGYNAAFNIKPDVEEQHILKYISVLNKLEKIDEVKRWVIIYNDKIKNKYPSSVYTDSTLDGTEQIKVHAKPINTKHDNRDIVNELKSETLFMYTSDGNEIQLSNQRLGGLEFDFLPGITYTLVIEQDNYKTGTIVTNSKKTELPKSNTYTFHIEKSDGVGYQQKDRSKTLQNMHINPGDLITFQLIPSKSQDFNTEDAKIRVADDEERIKSRATIVFSYIAEGDLEIPDQVQAVATASPKQAEKTTAPNDISDYSSVEGDKLSNLPNKTESLTQNQLDTKDKISDSNIDFQFRVQIAASKFRLSEAQLKAKYNGEKTIRSFKEDGLYKYFIEETSSYPDAKHTLKESGVTNAFIVAYKGETKWNLNEAVAFQKTNTKNLELSPTHEERNVTDNYNEVRFRVQIAASKIKLSDGQLRKIYNGLSEIRMFKEDGYFKYYIGETPSYDIAKQKLKETKISNAFIVAYKNNNKLSLQDALVTK
jgi:hypothetical protein